MRSPRRPKCVIDTTYLSAEAAAQQIILHLQTEGFLGRQS